MRSMRCVLSGSSSGLSREPRADERALQEPSSAYRSVQTRIGLQYTMSTVLYCMSNVVLPRGCCRVTFNLKVVEPPLLLANRLFLLLGTPGGSATELYHTMIT